MQNGKLLSERLARGQAAFVADAVFFFFAIKPGIQWIIPPDGQIISDKRTPISALRFVA
jgi:hypothetical protein